MNFQAHISDIPFQKGEKLKYEIRYKYGVVMLRAGSANYTISQQKPESNSAYQAVLDFKTTPFFDRIYKIRDTLISETNVSMEPVHHLRHINEGNTCFTEELFVNRFGAEYTEIRIKRHNQVTVKFDTIFSVPNIGFDMLNVFAWFRSLDYPNMENGKTFDITTFVGKDKVKMVVHYEGQSVIEKSENLKYKAFKLIVDIGDVAFKESKNAMEIWISDDKNRIPLKIRAKLKIGMAEAELSSYTNLSYPFTSEIKIPAR